MLKWQKIILITAALLDQTTKFLVRKYFFLHESREITDFLSLTYVQNTGIAFGFFQGARTGNIIFIFISIAILFLIILNKNAFEDKGGQAARAGIALIFGGATGNLIDRIMLGSVVDFIDFHFFPIFNVADSCITVGGILLFAAVMFSRKKDTEQNVS